MTNDERQKLDEIHDALFKAPIGGKKPLIEKIQAVVDAYDRGTWLGRFAIWAFIGFGGLIATWDKIWAFFRGAA